MYGPRGSRLPNSWSPRTGTVRRSRAPQPRLLCSPDSPRARLRERESRNKNTRASKRPQLPRRGNNPPAPARGFGEAHAAVAPVACTNTFWSIALPDASIYQIARPPATPACLYTIIHTHTYTTRCEGSFCCGGRICSVSQRTEYHWSLIISTCRSPGVYTYIYRFLPMDGWPSHAAYRSYTETGPPATRPARRVIYDREAHKQCRKLPAGVRQPLRETRGPDGDRRC